MKLTIETIFYTLLWITTIGTIVLAISWTTL